jgi:hypothetical protein
MTQPWRGDVLRWPKPSTYKRLVEDRFDVWLGGADLRCLDSWRVVAACLSVLRLAATATYTHYFVGIVCWLTQAGGL